MANFYHENQVPRGLRDYRDDVSRPIRLNNIYYVVLRVKSGNAVWYHHAAIAIDGGLPNHIESLKDVVRVSINWRKAEMTCVFVRCLVWESLFIMDQAARQKITGERNDRISKGALFCDEVERFLVIGFIGKSKITLIDAAAKNAMGACEEAIKLCAEQMKEDLIPAEAMAVSPAIPRILSIYEESVPHLLGLADTTCGVGGEAQS